MLLLPLVSGGHADRLGLLTLLLLALWIGPVAAGQHYTFSTYGLASGLSNLDVTTLIEDHTGLVWVGTQNGIFVADGSRFQEQKPFSDAGLEYIRAMREDAAGRIWAVDSRHLVYLENGRVRSVVALRIHLGAVDLLEVPGQPNTMYLLHDGELFQVASGDGGNSWQVLPAFNPTLKQKHPELLQLNRVINGGGSTVWAGCGSAVCLIDLKKATVRKFDERDGLHPDLWQSLLLTRAGALWARGQHVVEMLPAGSSRFSGVGDMPAASSLIRPYSQQRRGWSFRDMAKTFDAGALRAAHISSPGSHEHRSAQTNHIFRVGIRFATPREPLHHSGERNISSLG